jgi:hypothetical protein
MSPLRKRMIEDMILAGLALGTRQAYTQAVRRLAARYRRSPDQLSEEEVRGYLLELRQQGAARGTFKIGLSRPPKLEARCCQAARPNGPQCRDAPQPVPQSIQNPGAS